MITFIIATAVLGAYYWRDYFFGPRDNHPSSKFLPAYDPDKYAFPTNTLRQRGFATKFKAPHPEMHQLNEDFSLWTDPKTISNYKFQIRATKLLEENQFLDPLRVVNQTMGVVKNPYLSMNLSAAVPE